MDAEAKKNAWPGEKFNVHFLQQIIFQGFQQCESKKLS